MMNDDEDLDEDQDIVTYSQLKLTHPKSYGRLLLANKKIDDVRGSTFWIFLIVTIRSCVTLSAIDWKAKVGINATGWWPSLFLYSVITITCFMIWIKIDDAKEFKVYNQFHLKLIKSIDDSRIDRYEFLTRYEFLSMILINEDLSKLSECLAKDTDFIDLSFNF